MEPFGIGNMYIQPNKAGHYVEMATLQDISWDFNFDIKELHGSDQFPVSLKRGKGSITGSARVAKIRPHLFAAVLPDNDGVPIDVNPTPAAGYDLGAAQVMVGRVTAEAIAGTVAPATGSSTTIVVAPPNSGTFLHDIGVWYATSTKSQQLTQVASSPAVGQYTVSAGTYTFHATDAAAETVRIHYAYTVTNTAIVGASHMVIQNRPLGVTPVMKGIFSVLDNEGQFVLELFHIVPGGFKFGSKQDDWTMADFPMKAAAGCDGFIGRLSITDAENC